MKWYDANPAGANPGFRKEFTWDAHVWGRQKYASNFARGGMSSAVFATNPKESFINALKRPLKQGSPEHIRNLQIMQSNMPGNTNISKALDKAKASSSKLSLAGKIGSRALMGAFVAVPAFTTPGGIPEKARGVGGGIASLAGWNVGAVPGQAIGAGIGFALGGPIGAAVGFVAGHILGGFAGSMAAEGVYHGALGVADRAVERERSRRNLEWKHDSAAFSTQSAHTMRQQSLQAMNRGMTSARSMLGREGIMLHQ